MQYQVELKPFKEKIGQKYKVLKLTDLTLHTNHMRTTSLGKEIQKSFEKNIPGRIYSKVVKNVPSEQPVSIGTREIAMEFIQNDPYLMKVIQEEEANGYKVLFSIPKEGVPIFLGKDALEFIESKKGKRILRRLDRGKNED